MSHLGLKSVKKWHRDSCGTKDIQWGNQQILWITFFYENIKQICLISLGSCISGELCPYDKCDIIMQHNLHVKKGPAWKLVQKCWWRYKRNKNSIHFINSRTVNRGMNIFERSITGNKSVSLVFTSFESFYFPVCHRKHVLMGYVLANACSLVAAGCKILKRSQPHRLLPKPCCFLSPE